MDGKEREEHQMSIDTTEVRHVAKLAKLAFADNQILHFTEQMSDIIGMVEQLNEVDTTGVPVTTHGFAQVNIMREDIPEKGMDRDLLLRNVKTSEDGFIQVHAIMSTEEDAQA